MSKKNEAAQKDAGMQFEKLTKLKAGIIFDDALTLAIACLLALEAIFDLSLG